MTARPFLRAFPCALALALGGCATEAADEPRAFDASAGEVDVTVGADGFVVSAGERLPFDAFVLRLRQRARQMTRDQLDRFVVHVRTAQGVPEGDPQRTVMKAVDRLFRELELIGVTQARYF